MGVWDREARTLRSSHDGWRAWHGMTSGLDRHDDTPGARVIRIRKNGELAQRIKGALDDTWFLLSLLA